MRLGVCGDLIPADPDAVDDRVAARIAELGFEGVTAHFRGDPNALGRGRCRRASATLAAHGIAVHHSSTYGANLVIDHERTRMEQVNLVGAAMRVAADLGAKAVIGGAGSVAPVGGYAPHPDNRAPATRERLVDSLREVALRGEEHGVPLALECHVLGPLYEPERTREVLDEVDSPWIRANLDPVNLIGDLDTLYASGELIERMFEQLGPFAVSGHLKDAYVEDSFVMHISETVPGDGELDLAAFVSRFKRELPDAFMFIEHLPTGLVPRAKAALDRILEETGTRAAG